MSLKKSAPPRTAQQPTPPGLRRSHDSCPHIAWNLLSRSAIHESNVAHHGLLQAPAGRDGGAGGDGGGGGSARCRTYVSAMAFGPSSAHLLKTIAVLR
eukprot:5085759-Prymnesium_polylepis.1